MNNREESVQFSNFLDDLRSQREAKEVIDRTYRDEKDIPTQSLELCLGVKVNAMWKENNEGQNTTLNIDFIDTNKRVKGVMVWRLEELKNLKAI